MPSSENSQSPEGSCVLSLDAGGGPRGISQLMILSQLMNSLNSGTPPEKVRRPWQVFQVIGGVGSGGFIAILLAVFGLTAEEALKEFNQLSDEVLEIRNISAPGRTELLKTYIEELGDRHKICAALSSHILAQNERSNRCKLVIPISCRQYAESICMIRNFGVRTEESLDLTIRETILATLATPSLFSSISICKDTVPCEYTSADSKLPNPIRKVLFEAYDALGAEEHVACLLSIGCGHPGVRPLPPDSSMLAHDRVSEEILTRSETTAQEMHAQICVVGLYHRFSVASGLELLPLNTISPLELAIKFTFTFVVGMAIGFLIILFLVILDTVPGATLPDPYGWFLFTTANCVSSTIRIFRLTSSNDRSRLERLPRNEPAIKFTSIFVIEMTITLLIMLCCTLLLAILNAVLAPLPDAYVCFLFLTANCAPSTIRIVRRTSSNGWSRTLTARPSITSTEVQTHTEIYLRDMSLKSREGPCIVAMKSLTGLATLEQLVHSGGSLVLPLLPPWLERTFIQRAAPWAFLESVLGRFQGGNMFAITGGPGYGKSQIIRNFIKDLDDRFTSIFVVDGSSKERMQAEIIRNVRSTGREHSQKSFPECLIHLAQKTKPNSGPRLILYDNVDAEDIRPSFKSSFLPRGNSCIVAVTSRDRLFGNGLGKAHHELGVMTSKEAVDLLRTDLPDSSSDETLAEIAKELGYHPIALQQARSHMFMTAGRTASVYLGILKECRKALLNHPHEAEIKGHETVYATFDTSFRGLDGDHQRYLQLFSHFHWSDFPLQAITETAENDFDYCGPINSIPGEAFNKGKTMLKKIFGVEGKWELAKFTEIISTLRNSSLITFSQCGDTDLVGIHNLFHEWIQWSIQVDDQPTFRSAAILLLALGAQKKGAYWAKYLAIHVKSLLSHSDWELPDLNECWALGDILSDAGEHSLALEMRLRAVKQLEAREEVDVAIFHRSKEVSARTYRDLCRFKEALELEQEVLELRKKAFGDKSENVLLSHDSLAATYRKIGQFVEAGKHQVIVLDERKAQLEESHPNRILAASNLALTYRELGRFEEAKELQEDVLNLRREFFGRRDTILASSDLAKTYYDLRRYSDAEKLQKQVQSFQNFNLGDDHPDTSLASSNLASTWRAMKRYGEAETLQEEVLRSRKDVSGIGHPDTLSAYRELGRTRHAMERPEDAVELQKEGLLLTEEIFGKKNPCTTAATRNLALAYCDEGKYSKAAELQVKILESRKEESQEEDHPETINAISELAHTYLQLRRLVEAELLQDKALELVKRKFGDGHPDTVSAMRNVALILRERNRLDEAENIQAEILELRESLVGKESPDTIVARSELAETRRKVAEALEDPAQHPGPSSTPSTSNPMRLQSQESALAEPPRREAGNPQLYIPPPDTEESSRTIIEIKEMLSSGFIYRQLNEELAALEEFRKAKVLAFEKCGPSSQTCRICREMGAPGDLSLAGQERLLNKYFTSL